MRGETLAESSASRLWIMFHGAIPMATTRTLEEVLASEWSLTAWPKCLVMPKRRPFVKIHAPRDESIEISLSYLKCTKKVPRQSYKTGHQGHQASKKKLKSTR